MHPKIYPAKANGEDDEKCDEKDIYFCFPAPGEAHKEIAGKAVESDRNRCMPAWEGKRMFCIHCHLRARTMESHFSR